MIELQRIILVDWYLFRVEQIDIKGMTSLIGPNGAGKSAIIDAAQTVLAGANMLSIRFNASAQNASKSKRSIRDYCLGVVSLDEKGERSEPTREHAYTYAILGFSDLDSNKTINLGVAFSASETKSEETCEARFIVLGELLSKSDLLELLADDEVETRQWHAVRTLLRARGLEVRDDFGSASEFVDEALRTLSPPGFPIDARRFIRTFRNALLLKPVDNPTDFVRNYVLDVQPIRVDRLRRSIDLYRSLSVKIETLKAQSAGLAQMIRIIDRINDNERAISIAEWEVARLQWEEFRRKVRKVQTELKAARSVLEASEKEAVRAEAAVSRLEADAKRVELALATTQAAQLTEKYEAERKAAIAERSGAAAPITILGELLAKIGIVFERRIVAGRDEDLHALFELILDARGATEVRSWVRELPEDWEDQASKIDVALGELDVERLSAAQKTASDAFVAIKIEIARFQDRIDDIDRNLKRVEEGRSPIEAGTRALLDALGAANVHAEPLCDVVDVADERWRSAVEAALGRSREALIVAPNDASRALKIYRSGREEIFAYAELVNTTKTAQTKPAEVGSLATIIRTDNPHARAFLNFRLGRLAMVETEEQVLAAESAITPDRMMQSGRTIKRLARPHYLKLGSKSAEETRRLLTSERQELERLLAEKLRTATRAKEDCDAIEDLFRSVVEMQAKGLTSKGTAERIATIDGQIAQLGLDIEKAKRRQDPKLLQEAAELKTAVEKAKNARKAANDRLARARGDEGTLGGQLKEITDQTLSLRSTRRVAARFLPSGPVNRAKIGQFLASLNDRKLEPLSDATTTRQGDIRRRMVERRPQLGRELTSALSKYHQTFHVVLPFSDTDARADVVGPWASAEKSRLDGHELVQYEEKCRNAEEEMSSAFRDDLLHRLYDAFEGIKDTLNELNRHLKDRQFHGRDFYHFKAIESGTHADMIELVQESRRPDFQVPLFSKTPDQYIDTPIIRAIRRVQHILVDPEAKTEEIEDPRQYFNFELYIHDKDGKIRSSLSSRAGTGSGGEGQLPFYIAIGASLAATYQNRRTGQTGLALSVFDEAFNRLDTKAICECANFLRELGLQVVLAAPDEKRHVFMEVVDTVVNVNRSGNHALVETEYLTDKTRETLAEIDPYRKGFDQFKAERLAAGVSAGVADNRAEAAE